MILFAGIPSEPPLALAIAAAESLGVDHVVFNQRHSGLTDFIVEVGPDGPRGVLCCGGRDWPLAAFSAVYARLVDPAALPEHRPGRRGPADPERFARAAVLHDGLNQWLNLAGGRIVNRPQAMSSNASKPYQARLIAARGFATPPTLVTSDPAAARDFVRAHGCVVYKSVSSVRSIVTRLTPDRLDDLERVRLLPTQFQACVPGVDVRVHIVGERVFATEARSAAVDYRYARRAGCDVELAPTALPADLAARCVALARALELPFCGIDLKRTPAGEVVCFEANPSPAYSYYEEGTGQPIARTLVEYLAHRRD